MTAGTSLILIAIALVSIGVSYVTMLPFGRRFPRLAHAVMVVIYALNFGLVMKAVDDPVDAIVLAYSIGFGVVGVGLTTLLSLALVATKQTAECDSPPTVGYTWRTWAST